MITGIGQQQNHRRKPGCYGIRDRILGVRSLILVFYSDNSKIKDLTPSVVRQIRFKVCCDGHDTCYDNCLGRSSCDCTFCNCLNRKCDEFCGKEKKNVKVELVFIVKQLKPLDDFFIIAKKGTSVGGSVFIMCTLCKLSKERGFKYFIIMDEGMDETGYKYLIGFLNDRHIDALNTLTEFNAGLNQNNIIEVAHFEEFCNKSIQEDVTLSLLLFTACQIYNSRAVKMCNTQHRKE